MSDATRNMTNSSTLTDLTLNGGSVVNFGHADGEPWQRLTINEDFTGNGGKLVFNTVLNDDASETDKLKVLGNTAGNAFVAVNNIGGTGAQTVEGIEIIEVAGNSDGTFEKAGRIVAGAYDYNVVQKGSNWYLTSFIPAPPDRKSRTLSIRTRLTLLTQIPLTRTRLTLLTQVLLTRTRSILSTRLSLSRKNLLSPLSLSSSTARKQAVIWRTTTLLTRCS